jgi:hypothetical protein
MQNDRDQVKEMLKTRIEDLCAKLLPEGRRQNRLWVSYNPVTSDFQHSTPEFKVALTADRGAWKDWRSGDKGDVIGLISYVKGIDFKEAMAWARDFLGLRQMSAADRRALDAKMREVKRESDDNAERIRIWKIRHAEEKFLSGAMLGARSAAELHILRYIEARLTNRQTGEIYQLTDIAQLDDTSFRFHPASEYWTLAEYRADEHGRRLKVKDGPAFPAMHAAMRSPTGQTLACHCTFIDPMAPKKLNLGGRQNAKLMFGEAKGAVIRLTHGPEGLPPELATRPLPLVISEGIETGLSMAIAVPEARHWAAGSISNIGNAPVWLDCVGAVIVARDNNDGNAQAARQLDDALEELARANKPLEVIASHVGDDFNDLGRGEE